MSMSPMSFVRISALARRRAEELHVMPSMRTSPLLPTEMWSVVVSFLSFRDASRGRTICKSFDEAVRRLEYLDFSECKSLLKTDLLVKNTANAAANGGLQCTKLTVQMIRFLEEHTFPWRFPRVHLTGSEISSENMLTKIPSTSLFEKNLVHLTITNAAFVTYASRPNSTFESYFTFDVSGLAHAVRLQSFHIQFDRVREFELRGDNFCYGVWLRGMEHCRARDVRIVVELPPKTGLKSALPIWHSGAGGGLKDRMAFLVRIPSGVHHLYILTDCVLWLDRPAGDKYPRLISEMGYSDDYIRVGNPPEIFNMCLLSLKRPTLDLPNTQIRRLHPSPEAAFHRPLICVTSKCTPDHIYASNLSRLAPGHCNLSLAEEIPIDSWDDE